MRFRKVIIWNTISTLSSSGITFLSTIILARLLTPEDFGIIGIVSIFILISQMIVDSEMGGALLRKKEVNHVDYSTLFYYNLCVSVLLYALFFALAPLIAKFYGKIQLTEIIRVLCFTIIIHAFRVVQRIMLFRELKFNIYTIITLLSGFISLAIAILLATRGYGYWALIWQQLVGASTAVIFMTFYNKFIPRIIFSKESFKYQFKFGISLLGSDFIGTLANNISTNIIAKIANLEFAGYYTQTARLCNFGQSTIGSILDQSIFPVLAKHQNIQIVINYFNKLLLYITLFLGIITAICYVFADSIIAIFLGKEWLNAAWMLKILSLTILPICIQRLCRNIMKTIGITKVVLIIEIIKSIVIISSLFSAVYFGTSGILWALVIAQLISTLIWLLYTKYLLKKQLISNIVIP